MLPLRVAGETLERKKHFKNHKYSPDGPVPASLPWPGNCQTLGPLSMEYVTEG